MHIDFRGGSPLSTLFTDASIKVNKKCLKTVRNSSHFSQFARLGSTSLNNKGTKGHCLVILEKVRWQLNLANFECLEKYALFYYLPILCLVNKMETKFSAEKFHDIDIPFSLYSNGQIDWTMWKVYDKFPKKIISDMTYYNFSLVNHRYHDFGIGRYRYRKWVLFGIGFGYRYRWFTIFSFDIFQMDFLMFLFFCINRPL